MDKIKEKIRELARQPLYTAIAGLVVGLIIGLPILGWGLFPVKWVDADPSYLREDLKKQYVCMVVDSYNVNRDANLAASRLTAMGVEDLKNPKGLFKDLEQGRCNYTNSDPVVMEMKSAFLDIDTGSEETIDPGKPVEGADIPLPQEEIVKEKSGRSTLLLVVLLALFLLIAGALVYIFFIRNRRFTERTPEQFEEEEPYLEEETEADSYTPVEVEETYPEVEEDTEIEEPYIEEPDVEAQEITEEVIEPPVMKTKIAAPITPALSFAGEPVAYFMTSYLIGDDLYDDSFSIDAPNGAFLGECGVGISDTIGVGDPKKVTAFEVWLFDKNDIQTVTKVLMSSHAMNDSGIKQRLASKGEPVLLEPGQQILLETATLQLEAKVIEMVYGQGALPSGSFVERLTLELSVWPK